MFPCVHTTERSFASVQELRAATLSRRRQECETRLSKVAISASGILQAGGLEGLMTRYALTGLLHIEGIPQEFALEKCPPDLLPAIIQRLAQARDAYVRIHMVDGVVTAIMPVSLQSVRLEMIVDRISDGHKVQEATLDGGYLRLIGITDIPLEALPNDTFSSGWELTAYEDGWHPTQVSRFLVRQVCSNGMVGFDREPVYRRAHNSREPILVSLDRLVQAITDAACPPELKPAVQWAAEHQLGDEYESIINYLVRALDEDATRQALSDITPLASWYQLLNSVTALAKFHNLEMRRRHEVEGGKLLAWASRGGRGRRPWSKAICDGCPRLKETEVLPAAGGQS
jgi:hypothetical protein